jgi:abortive infection bacteriophage resistance protein
VRVFYCPQKNSQGRSAYCCWRNQAIKAFCKPPLNATQQRKLLEQRGLSIRDGQRAEQLLEVVSFFRLSPYMRPFQLGDAQHTFKEGVQLGDIVAVYRFDGALRHLVMDALERVEVAVRSCISNHMCCQTQNVHWYLDPAHFRTNYDHRRLLADVQAKLDEEAKHLERERQRILRSQADENTKTRRIENRTRDNYARYYVRCNLR